MAISYKKLWKMLIDKDLSKTELTRIAGLSTNAMAKCSCTVRKQATENKR